MKKILVTGASGFIGRHVIEDLLDRNISVIATATSDEKIRKMPWAASIKFISFDLRAYSSEVDYYSYFNKPDCLIHLAWEGLPNYKSLFHIEENLFRHYNFIKNLVQNGLPDVTITGTCFEYGLQEGCLSEELCPQPNNAYAVAKDNLRRFLQELQNHISFSFKWVRLFYMYGKGQNPKSLFPQLDKAIENKESIFNMSGGEQLRDYLPVNEVASYINSIALQNKIAGIINCCSGRPISIKELVQDYLQQRKQQITLNTGYYPYNDYEPMNFWGDNSKLKLILNK